MISRRLLRVKVLKSIFSSLIADQTELAKIENELLFSINKVYDLYVYLFLFIIEIRNYAQLKIEEGKNKFLPVYEDLNPNTKFINNAVIKQIEENKELKNYANTHKIGWQNEIDFIKKKYEDLKSSGIYKKYMSNPKSSYAIDKKFVYDFYELIMFNPEDYEQLLEDKSIYWIDDLDFSVSHIIKTIRSFNETTNADTPILLNKEEKDKDEKIIFAKTLLTKTLSNLKKYDKLISEKLLNWDIDRIAIIDNIIIKMALCELLEFPIIPVKVTLNEYIEIAKTYSTPKSKLFINGVLDKLVMDFKRQNILEKIEPYDETPIE